MNNRKTAAIYTLLHLLVDFSTVFLVSHILLGPIYPIANRANVIIMYNLIAFAGQLPIGILSDVTEKNRFLVALSCAVICISYFFAPFSGWLSLCFAAVGNAIFHVASGSDILKMSMPKAGLSGLFVSSGAIGVWLAYKADAFHFSVLCPTVMLAASAFLFFSAKGFTTDKNLCKISYKAPPFTVFAAITCFMLTIVIRSLLGMVMNFSWKAVPHLSFLFVLGVFAGKALGGFIGDKFGYIKTTLLTLSAALILFVFSFRNPFCGILATLCFNMTMPLTLTAISGVCGKKYGFAFGMTTFALAIGFIPTVFNITKLFSVPFLLCGTALSLVLMLAGYAFLTRNTKCGL